LEFTEVSEVITASIFAAVCKPPNQQAKEVTKGDTNASTKHLPCYVKQFLHMKRFSQNGEWCLETCYANEIFVNAEGPDLES
jgi:hypothetical protein